MMIMFRIRLRFPKSFSRSSSVSVSVSGLEDEACSSSPGTAVVVIVGCCVCTYNQPAQYIGRTVDASGWFPCRPPPDAAACGQARTPRRMFDRNWLTESSTSPADVNVEYILHCERLELEELLSP